MVIHDLYVICVLATPAEADPPSIVNPDAMLSGSILLERFKRISRRNAQLFQFVHCVQLSELTKCHALNVRRDASTFPFVKELFCLAIRKSLDHKRHSNARRY